GRDRGGLGGSVCGGGEGVGVGVVGERERMEWWCDLVDMGVGE
ncbi:MAG: hypothetical protein ACI8XM_000060, partial [Haloarculaceae archaeon]